ncbi:hypothetical protein M0804_007011 [Polistes exclamans]|nr:hypothetical protein M0804_007011 [Polistes exclamans]
MPSSSNASWFHLSQGIEVSIAAAILHTRPLPYGTPLLHSLRFFTLIYNSDLDTEGIFIYGPLSRMPSYLDTSTFFISTSIFHE